MYLYLYSGPKIIFVKHFLGCLCGTYHVVKRAGLYFKQLRNKSFFFYKKKYCIRETPTLYAAAKGIFSRKKEKKKRREEFFSNGPSNIGQ